MSDLSVLAQQYETTAELSRTINDAVIALKKVHERLPGADALTPGELRACRERLASIAEALSGLLDPGSGSDIPDASAVTGSLVARLQAAHQGELTYFADDLRRTSRRLRCDDVLLTRRDLALLDQVATAADAETSHVFRRLMRV
jgi:hypothetical protein